MKPITKRTTRKFLPVVFAFLIASLLMALSGGTVFAQGIQGKLTYTVADGKQLLVWPSPQIQTVDKALGAVNAGTYSVSANELSDGWYLIPSAKGYINMNDAAVSNHSFSAGDAAPTTAPGAPTATVAPSGGGDSTPPVGNGNSGHTRNTRIGNVLQLVNFGKLPTFMQAWVLMGMFIISVLIIVLAIWESVRTKRWKLLYTLAGFLIGGLLWQILMAAFVYFNGEWCLEGQVCVPDKILTALGAFGDVVIMIAAVVLMYMNGAGSMKKPPLTDEEHNKYVKEETEKIDETIAALEHDGWKLRGSIRDLVGKEAGNSDAQLYMPLEDAHREGAPVGVFLYMKSLFVWLGGLIGQAFFSFLHFMKVTDFGSGLVVTTLPVLLMAMVCLPFEFIESGIENRKRAHVWLFWLTMWAAVFFLPIPPILTLILFFLGTNWFDGGFKNFWSGYSDLLKLTLVFVAILTLGGWYGFWAPLGYFWVDSTTYLPSWNALLSHALRNFVIAGG